MARCLIIGCGCRGRGLTHELVARGHAVRGTTRDPSRAGEIERAGADGFIGDPDRVATIVPALEHVSVVCILLGCAVGSSDQVHALHGTRLEMLLVRTLDTTVRGVVYEAAGSVEQAVLRSGTEIVRRACEGSRIPYAVVDQDPSDYPVWLPAATRAVDRVLRREPI